MKTTQEVEEELNVNHLQIVQYLYQTGKSKKIGKCVSHELNEKKNLFCSVLLLCNKNDLFLDQIVICDKNGFYTTTNNDCTKVKH